jgi:hypothetical protein
VPTYRIFGSVITAIYTDVSADTAESALEIARTRQPEDFTLLNETFGIDNEVEEITD